MKYCFCIYLLAILLACKQKKFTIDQKPFQESSPADSNWEKGFQEQHRNDSIKLAELYSIVMSKCESKKHEGHFQGEIDSSVLNYKNIQAKYFFGNIFSSDKKHLLVKRFIDFHAERQLFYDIFIYTNHSFKKIVSGTSDSGYYKDSLMDINGDGHTDYLISSYSHTGCCPRDANNIYLYNVAKGDFKEEYLFNPEFNFKAKIVYETEYGFPGKIAIEKYKWSGLQKIKLESISPTYTGITDEPLKPYSYTKITYPSQTKTILKRLPSEYKKLNIYKYFIAYQEQ